MVKGKKNDSWGIGGIAEADVTPVPIIETIVNTVAADVAPPQELNLERWQGLSYTKGCYPGQEIVARLRYRGTVKRGLSRLLAPESKRSELVPGCRLLNVTGDPVGTVLYAGSGGARGTLALAVVDFSAHPAPALFCEPGGAPISVIGIESSPETEPHS